MTTVRPVLTVLGVLMPLLLLRFLLGIAIGAGLVFTWRGIRRAVRHYRVRRELALVARLPPLPSAGLPLAYRAGVVGAGSKDRRLT